jgi:hypothetical protein
MIPEIQPPALYYRTTLPGRTYRLDSDKGVVRGMIDGLDAVRQFVYKALLTTRGEHVIYSSDFGSEHGTVGQSHTLLQQSEIKRTITEALIYDDRISRVYNFSFEQAGEALLVRFQVDSIAGSFQMEVI